MTDIPSDTVASDTAYCNSLTSYQRFKSRAVMIGNVGVGGDNPIRIQSMTTTDTMDTMGTVEQSIRMIEAGCEIVRITAPSKKEAENLQLIKNELRSRGYDTPLVADIHFTPNAAEIAARIVEKVRVNPGNYADKKKFEELEYTDATYQEELDRIRERFTPLVKICKEHGAAMRIGTNHGSLSDRIMSRYGDTANGMVESALEFLRICEDNDYHEIVLSMKSSNTQVMVEAYRLLVSRMMAEGMNYPLHLGVTEAGEGEDGRIKSAVGIGTLLEDGLGDTIRVSLTEEPEFEAPVAIALAKRYENRSEHQPIPAIETYPVTPFEYNRRASRTLGNIGGKNVPVVVHDYSKEKALTPASLFGVGYQYSVPLDKWNMGEMACDYLYTGDLTPDFQIPGTLGILCNADTWQRNKQKPRLYPVWSVTDYMAVTNHSEKINFIRLSLNDATPALLQHIKADKTAALIIETDNLHGMAEQRRLFCSLLLESIDVPVIIHRKYQNLEPETLQLDAATDFGALLIDGLGDGILLESHNCGGRQQINQTMFGILQATRTRISKTEYISCPSCGRTLFDLQETTAKIRSRTDHLKGLKIGIMGCIVNGPGEMADADYGYVGTGPGKITLYKEKEVVKRNVPSEQAVDELIGLIKTYGDWVEPAVD